MGVTRQFLKLPSGTYVHIMFSFKMEILKNPPLTYRNGDEDTGLVKFGRRLQKIKRSWMVPKGF